MAGNPTFTTFFTSTIRKYRKKLVSNLLGNQALWWQLDRRGFVTEEKGGRSIVQPLLYAENDTVSSFKGYDIIDVAPQDGITAAEYEWKYIAGSVTISKQEEFENSGDSTQIFKLLDAKVKQLEESMELELNRQLFADGTGNGSKDITGLGIAVEDGAAWSTYAGIDGSDAANAFWRNQYLAFGGTSFGTTSNSSVEGLDIMRTMYNNCTTGRTRPTLIVATQDIFEAYEAYYEGQKQRHVNSNSAMADAGFTNFEYKGVPIVFDEDMNANEMLFLNSDYMKLVLGKGLNFTTTPFQRPHNQMAKTAQLLVAGNVVLSKRKVHGRITALTT